MRGRGLISGLATIQQVAQSRGRQRVSRHVQPLSDGVELDLLGLGELKGEAHRAKDTRDLYGFPRDVICRLVRYAITADPTEKIALSAESMIVTLPSTSLLLAIRRKKMPMRAAVPP